MVFAKTIALLAVLVPAILVDAKKSSTRYQQLRRRRLGKKMGDGNVDRDGLSETSQCVPFDNPKVQLAAKGLVRNGKKGSNDGDGDGANSCSTNTCGGGCCRYVKEKSLPFEESYIFVLSKVLIDDCFRYLTNFLPSFHALFHLLF